MSEQTPDHSAEAPSSPDDAAQAAREDAPQEEAAFAVPRSWWADLHFALSFMTRLPLPLPYNPVGGSLARAMGMFPLVGVVVGAIGALVYGAAGLLLPPTLAALLAVAAMVRATGCLHEDGLADVADGFGGGWEKQRKLDIMKDSRIGTYGMVAVVLTIGLRVAALAALAGPWRVAAALLTAHALSRAAIPVLMQFLSPARPDGLGAKAGQPDRATAFLAAGIAAGVAVITLPISTAFAAAVVTALAVKGMARLAQKHLGGHTGDVLGATQQVAEVAVLLAIVAVWR